MHVMAATFHPNPNEESEPWIERTAIDGYTFRVWHLMIFTFIGFVFFVVFVCCCVRIRIPRTKQQIEANHQRKKLVDKFKERIKLIENQHLDDLDLRAVLELIQEDYQKEMDDIETNNARSDAARSKVNVLVRILRLGHSSQTGQHQNQQHQQNT